MRFLNAMSFNDNATQILLKQLNGLIDDMDMEVVQKALEEGANYQAITNTILSPLALASKQGHLELCKLLLKYGANPEDRGCSTKPLLYQPPLALAVMGGHFEIIELLIQFGANLESLDYQIKTPLALAASLGEDHICRLLIEKGAQVNMENSEIKSPLIEAIQHEKWKTALLLLEAGANPNTLDLIGIPALSFAVFKKGMSVSQKLIELGAHVSFPEKEEFSPLWWSITFNPQSVDFFRFLLDNGASMSDKELFKNKASLCNNNEIINLIQILEEKESLKKTLPQSSEKKNNLRI